VVVALVIVATLGASLFVLSGILPQIILAGLIAFLMEPLIGWLHRKARFPKWLAILVVYLLLAVIVFYAIFIVPVLVIDSIAQIDFSEISASVDDWLASVADNLANVTIFGETMDLTPIIEAIQSDTPPADPTATIGDLLFGALSAFAGAFGLVFSVIGFILFTGLVAIYFSGGATRYARSSLNIFPERARPDAIYVGQQVNEVWDDYIRGTAVMMVLIGTTTALVTWLLGVPGALFLGLIAGLLECIPTFGPIISTVPAVIVALVQGSNRFTEMNNVIFALIVIVAYILIQQLESSILQPRIVGGAVILPPIIVLLAITAGLQVYGVLGAIIAVPVVATVRAINRFLWARAVPDSRVSIAEEEREE
jgi:predicted PurR-regulated permease PerM